MKNIKLLTIAMLLSFGSFVYGENEVKQSSTIFNNEENRAEIIKSIEEKIVSIENKNKPLTSESMMSGLFNVLNNPTIKPMVVPVLLVSIGAVSFYQYYRLVQARQKLEQAKLEQAEKQAAQEEKQEHSDGLQA